MWKFLRMYEMELRLLNAGSSPIQGECQDPITSSIISAPRVFSESTSPLRGSTRL